jgi:hypothetical protein
MHVPAPIAELVSGPGRLISAGFAFLAAIFGILAEGYVGISVFVIIVLILVVAELWRESGSLTGERDGARSAEQTTRSLLEREQEKTQAMTAVIEHEEALERQVEWLREELTAQSTNPSRLLRILIGHAELIRLAVSHRELSMGRRTCRWPILGITIDRGQVAAISCYADGSEYADGEPVALVATASGEIQTTAQATVSGDQLLIVVPLNELPAEILDELETNDDVHPDGYMLELAGLAIKTYDGVSDERLRELERAVSTAMQSASSALRHDLDQEGGVSL